MESLKLNLSELRDLIRAEANVKGAGEYSNLIDQLVNQELQRLTGKGKCQELLTELIYTSPANETFSFDLPDDFQILDSIIFSSVETALAPASYLSPYALSKGSIHGFQRRTMGRPQYYHRVGNTIKVYPYTEFYINETLTLTYYKRPELLLDTDLLPVEALIPAVQQYVVGRLLRMVDTRKSQLTMQGANQAFLDSRTEHAGD